MQAGVQADMYSVSGQLSFLVAICFPAAVLAAASYCCLVMSMYVSFLPLSALPLVILLAANLVHVD